MLHAFQPGRECIPIDGQLLLGVTRPAQRNQHPLSISELTQETPVVDEGRVVRREPYSHRVVDPESKHEDSGRGHGNGQPHGKDDSSFGAHSISWLRYALILADARQDDVKETGHVSIALTVS